MEVFTVAKKTAGAGTRKKAVKKPAKTEPAKRRVTVKAKTKRAKATQAKGPSARALALHRKAHDFNWDDDLDELRKIIRSPSCDLGTALLVYWRGQPDFFRRFANRQEVSEPETYYMLVEIEEKVLGGFYKKACISFDPFHDRGDQTSKPKRTFHCDLPEQMYFPVGKKPPLKKIAARRPHSRRPVGLSWIAEQGIPGVDEKKQQAIDSLNALKPDSGIKTVEIKDGRMEVNLSHIPDDDVLRHLKHLPEVTFLMLDEGMTDEALKYLRHVPDLEELWLEDGITDDGLRHLRHVPALRRLQLFSDEMTGDGLKYLRHVPSLQTLFLYSEIAIGEYLKHLKHVPQLTLLDLEISDADAAAKHLTHVPQLETLSMPDDLTNAGVPPLVKLQRLKSLDLSETEIDDECIEHLARMKKLEQLIVDDTNISRKGKRRLKELLPNVKFEY